MIGRLSKACYGRLQAAYDTWKYDTFQHLKIAVEHKKAKTIDTLVRNSMSPLQKCFMNWVLYLRNLDKYEYGQRVKAGFALHALVSRFYRDRKREYCLYALRQIGFNPDRLMRAAFQKMLRAAGVNVERAWLRWKMNHLAEDRNRVSEARRNIAAANLGNCLDKKKKRHLRAGMKPIAADVAQNKAKEKIVGRLAFACFGRMQ
jgi:hypothetical protein